MRILGVTASSYFSILIDYLVVAGGGAGGQYNNAGGRRSGGGGAGGLRTSFGASGGGASAETPISALLNDTFSVTVGAPGVNSVFGTITAVSGGNGGGGASAVVGSSGGSGGGSNQGALGAAIPAASGTANQGYAGGIGDSDGGGGGGAGAVGKNGHYITPPRVDGGVGVASTITGTSIYYAGGGGGAGGQIYNDTLYSTRGVGGLGGGGNGSQYSGTVSEATAGVPNTGGGGGGSNTATVRSGGSGVVVLRYPKNLNANFGQGLVSTTDVVGSSKVTQFIAGSGDVTISEAPAWDWQPITALPVATRYPTGGTYTGILGAELLVLTPSTSSTGSGTTYYTYSYATSTWTSRSLPSSLRWSNPASNGKRVVVCGSGAVSYSATGAYSDDGIAWTTFSFPSVARWDVQYFVTHLGGMFIASASNVSSNNLAWSYDGATWNSGTIGTNAAGYRKISYGNGKFIAVGENTTNIRVSTDLSNWSTVVLPGNSTDDYMSVVYGNGTWVAINSSTTPIKYSTDNGVTWSSSSTDSTEGPVNNVYFLNGKFITVTNSGLIESVDGITWTVASTDANFQRCHGAIDAPDGYYILAPLASTTDIIMKSSK